MNRDGFRTCLFLTGSFFIVWPAATLGLSVIGFALGVPLSRWQILSGFVLAAVFLIVGAVKLSPAAAKTVAASSLGLVVVLTPAAAFAAEAFIDTSYDGRAYHQNTLIQMATGWNPVARPLEPDGRSLDYEPLPRSPWTVHFPKSAETTAAAFVKATGRIESGKAFNILLLYSAFALSLYALLGFAGLRLRSALLFASLAALNPVTICTLHSYYVDGQMASLLTGLFALILALWREKGLWPLAVLGPALVLTINTKFPGLGYAFFLSGGLLAGFLILRQGRRLLAAGAVCLLSGIIGFGAVGYNPYITNWKHFGHPLHPAYGPRSFGEEDMKRFLSTPPNLADKNRFEQFFISLTSRSDYVPYPEPTRRKLPFTVTAGEVASFGNTTIRAGGFGPLFGGIVLLLVPFAAVGFFLGGRRSLPHLGFVLLVALTIAVNPQCWWARLTPQAWLLPLIFLFFLSRLKPRRKAVRWGVAVLLVLTVMNLGLVLGSNTVQQTGRTLLLRRKLDRLARADRPILLVTGAFPSTRALLAERGIRFQEVEALPEGFKPHRLADGVLYARPNAPRRHDE